MDDVTVDFPLIVSSGLEEWAAPDEASSPEKGVFGATFSGEVAPDQTFAAPKATFGVIFETVIEDNSQRSFFDAGLGIMFTADITYPDPVTPPSPNLPTGLPIEYHSHFGKPAIVLPLLPAALGQAPSAQIIHEFKKRTVRSMTHLEQRQLLFGHPLRTYTFDYVVYPNEQFSIMHALENSDRFPVIVPIFTDMYRFTRTIHAGEVSWAISTSPGYHLKQTQYVMVFDGHTKYADLYQVAVISGGSSNGQYEYIEGNPILGTLESDRGAVQEYSPRRHAIFPCMVGWVDSFAPQKINRKTLAGTLTVREYKTGPPEGFMQE